MDNRDKAGTQGDRSRDNRDKARTTGTRQRQHARGSSRHEPLRAGTLTQDIAGTFWGHQWPARPVAGRVRGTCGGHVRARRRVSGTRRARSRDTRFRVRRGTKRGHFGDVRCRPSASLVVSGDQWWCCGGNVGEFRGRCGHPRGIHVPGPNGDLSELGTRAVGPVCCWLQASLDVSRDWSCG